MSGASLVHRVGDASRRLRVHASASGIRGRRRGHGLPVPLYVSVTSYPRRYPVLAITLRSLLVQSLRPDGVLLWVTDEERNALPSDVLRLERHGLTIRSGSADLRSYAKLVFTLEAHPEAVVVTADDDTYYWRRWLESLVAAHRREPRSIWSHRAHWITVEPNGSPRPYACWEHRTARVDGDRLFPTGVGGVLYPPGALHPDALDRNAFLRLAPQADDLWFYWQAKRVGTTVRRLPTRRPLRTWIGASPGLAEGNVGRAQNDAQLAALVAAYGLPWHAEVPPRP